MAQSIAFHVWKFLMSFCQILLCICNCLSERGMENHIIQGVPKKMSPTFDKSIISNVVWSSTNLIFFSLGTWSGFLFWEIFQYFKGWSLRPSTFQSLSDYISLKTLDTLGWTLLRESLFPIYHWSKEFHTFSIWRTN